MHGDAEEVVCLLADPPPCSSDGPDDLPEAFITRLSALFDMTWRANTAANPKETLLEKEKLRGQVYSILPEVFTLADSYELTLDDPTKNSILVMAEYLERTLGWDYFKIIDKTLDPNEFPSGKTIAAKRYGKQFFRLFRGNWQTLEYDGMGGDLKAPKRAGSRTKADIVVLNIEMHEDMSKVLDLHRLGTRDDMNADEIRILLNRNNIAPEGETPREVAPAASGGKVLNRNSTP
ncbi:hypothetical protein T484DRAFT_1858895 [Baffinella frigidus]|nr:hypothetical protein T484DRAFT_1858895 [Cryptophyta sp. CCMP2293]